MAFSKRVALLLSMAAMTAVGSALPASANVAESPEIASVLESETVNLAFDASLDLPTANSTDVAPAPEAAPVETSPVVSAAPAVTKASLVDADAVTSADLLLAPVAEVTPVESIQVALQNSSVESRSIVENDLIAQATGGGTAGVAANYLGIGGNLGIGDNKSPLSDMGFAVISKISFSPRFSVRPAALIAEKGVSFAIPVTYNFNTTSMGGFNFQPYAGVGADIATVGSVGLLLSAGVDVPVSPNFTINAATNFRVTDGFGLGVLVGVGYNFPFLFD